MALVDHGGADVAVEAPKAELLLEARTYVFPNFQRQIQTSFFRGVLTLNARIADIELTSPDLITFHYALATTELAVTDRFRAGGWVPVSTGLPPIPVDGSVRGDFVVEVAGTTIQVQMAGRAGSIDDAVTVTFEPGGFFGEPLIEAILWEQALRYPTDPSAIDRLREDLARDMEGVLHEVIVAYLGIFSPTVLVSPPFFPTPLGAPPSTVAAAFRIQGTSVLAVFAVGGTTGTPSAISRSNIGSGPPPDRAAFVLSNASLLRDLVRPVLMGTFGIGGGGFLAAHPCWLVGPVPLPFAPRPRPLVTFTGAFLDSLIAGVAESGSLHALMQLRFTFNLFTIAVAVDLPIAMSLTKPRPPAPGSPAAFLLLTPGTPTITSRVDMPPWVYALSALLGGSIGVSALALADAIVDSLPGGTLGLRVVPPVRSLSIGMPSVCRPLGATSVARTQSDAPSRSVVIAGRAFPDPFRAHDLIMSLA